MSIEKRTQTPYGGGLITKSKTVTKTMRNRPNQAQVKTQGNLQVRISQRVYPENIQESTASVKRERQRESLYA